MQQEVSNTYVFIRDEKGFCPLGSLYVGRSNLFSHPYKNKERIWLVCLFHSVVWAVTFKMWTGPLFMIRKGKNHHLEFMIS